MSPSSSTPAISNSSMNTPANSSSPALTPTSPSSTAPTTTPTSASTVPEGTTNAFSPTSPSSTAPTTTPTSASTVPEGTTNASSPTSPSSTAPTTTPTSASTVPEGTTNASSPTSPSSTAPTTTLTSASTVLEGTTNASSPTSPSSTAPPTTKIMTTTPTPTTTPTTPPTTTTIPTTMPPKVPGMTCENGGTYDGIKCNCDETYYYGPHCEFAVEAVTIETYNRTVDVTARITNEKLTENLKDTSTVEYKTFSTNFKQQMFKLYKGVDGYKDVDIISLTEGSIIVDYKVILEIKAVAAGEEKNDRYKDAVNNITSIMMSTTCTKNETGNENCSGGFQFDTNSLKVRNVSIEEDLTKADLCKSLGDLIQFYELYIDEKDAVSCISICNSLAKGFVNCTKNGKCELLNSGPSCFCLSTEEYLYTGSHCKIVINKYGLYGGIAAALLVLVIVITTLTVFVIRRKGKQQKEWDSKQDLVDKWFDDDVEWHAPEGFTVARPESVNWEGLESRESASGTGSSNFTPSLTNVNTTVEVKFCRPQISIT
ncbi:mucin-3A [Latimeria chalumnae]|uniref:mucin-3A n=1 Tax=Latimeria chalumnae TaxID=7897 RepID=UPI00313CE280